MIRRSSRKRKHKEPKEFEDVSSVTGPASGVSIHGILVSVSPMMGKKAKHFDGQIRDDQTSMRIVGFHSDARRKLLENKGKNINLTHCDIKYARKSSQLELVVTKSTIIHKSETSLLPRPTKRPMSITPLSQLEQLQPLEEVIVEVRVDHVEVAKTVHGGRKKQDILVRDDKDMAKVTLWESNVGKLKALQSYRLSGLVVQKYKGKTSLSTAKRNIKIEKIPPVADIKLETSGTQSDDSETRAESTSGRSSHTSDYEEFKIIGVDQFDMYTGCMKCSSEVVCIDSADVGECMNCHMVQSMSECPTLLKSMVIAKCRASKMPLIVYHQQILDIAQLPASKITPMVLLKAEKFSMDYDQGVIKSITRIKSKPCLDW